MTLTNDFHNTLREVRATEGDIITERRVRAIRHSLCGMTGCSCCDGLGRLGKQPDNGGLDFEPLAGGIWRVTALIK